MGVLFRATGGTRQRGFIHILVLVVLAALAIAPSFRRHELTIPETAFEEENAAAFITPGMRRPDNADPLAVTVFVIGEVRSPGVVSERAPLTLAQVIGRAEPLESASRQVTIVRPGQPGAAAPTLPGAPEALTLSANVFEATILSDGDTVYVPRAPIFYVLGEVRYPGLYVFEPGTTVVKAISLAGGLTDRGSERAVSVSRLVKGKRKNQDLTTTDTLMANDVLRVGRRLF